MIGFQDYWYGKECEGRLTGLKTLFIGSINEDVINKISTTKAPHIYICSVALHGANKELWDILFKLVTEHDKMVTVETSCFDISRIPPMIMIHCHILVMFNASNNISKLKPTDSIKIVYDDYSLYCSTIENMQHVKPIAYSNDVTSNRN